MCPTSNAPDGDGAPVDGDTDMDFYNMDKDDLARLVPQFLESAIMYEGFAAQMLRDGYRQDQVAVSGGTSPGQFLTRSVICRRNYRIAKNALARA